MLFSKFINYDVIPGPIVPEHRPLCLRVNGTAVNVHNCDMVDFSGLHFNALSNCFWFVYSNDGVRLNVGNTIINLNENRSYLINESRPVYLYKTTEKPVSFRYWCLHENRLSNIVFDNVFGDVSADFLYMWDNGNVEITKN